MLGMKRVFPNGERLPMVLDRHGSVARRISHLRQAIEAHGGIRMIRAPHPATNRQRLAEQSVRFVVSASVEHQPAEVHQAAGQANVPRTQQFAPQVQRFAEQALGFIQLLLITPQQADAVQTLRDFQTLVA